MSRAPTAPLARPVGIDFDLTMLLRRVKLGRLLDKLPERLALARSESHSRPRPSEDSLRRRALYGQPAGLAQYDPADYQMRHMAPRPRLKWRT